tara:strand:- start:407 stop:658 length:252 start_codon:yes stop_codon:yes gene_type:complete
MDNKTSSDYSSLLTKGSSKKQKWLNFMTDMPKGYRTKEEMAAKRRQLNATDLGASHPIGNRNEKVKRSFPLGNRREKITGQLM